MHLSSGSCPCHGDSLLFHKWRNKISYIVHHRWDTVDHGVNSWATLKLNFLTHWTCSCYGASGKQEKNKCSYRCPSSNIVTLSRFRLTSNICPACPPSRRLRSTATLTFSCFLLSRQLRSVERDVFAVSGACRREALFAAPPSGALVRRICLKCINLHSYTLCTYILWCMY